MKLQKKTIEKLENLAGELIYHGSPGYQMKDTIESIEIDDMFIYFNLVNRDYYANLPINKVHKFLNRKNVLFGEWLHPMGFNIYTDSCSLIPCN